MQIKPSTARSSAVGISDVITLENNIHAGTKYLRYLADQFFPGKSINPFNRIMFALASYNAGPNRIAACPSSDKAGCRKSAWPLQRRLLQSTATPISIRLQIADYFRSYDGQYKEHAAPLRPGRSKLSIPNTHGAFGLTNLPIRRLSVRCQWLRLASNLAYRPMKNR